MQIETVEPEASHFLSEKDELANVFTHAIGIVLSLLAGFYFWFATQERELGLRVCCLIYCAMMTAVYSFSTLSHAVRDPARRNRMRAWDQGTIYLLIVGTYSPFIWAGSSGGIRIAFFCLVWSAAVCGFVAKVFASHRINAVATITYLALGWLPALPLIPTTPAICFVWMMLGGVCYSIGVIFLNLSTNRLYMHAVWHILVIAGSACHAYAITLLWA
ncbi:MAG: hemolysin III family protein [Pirellulaceae bacterium]